jgi:hypothetical protein
MFFGGGFSAKGAGTEGAVRLIGARIAGTFDARGARLSNPTGPAMVADGLEVSGSAFLSEGFTARGAGQRGAVRLLKAKVDGSLHLQTADIASATSTALDLDSSIITGYLFLDHGLAAKGAGPYPVINLISAELGTLSVDGSIEHDSNPRLRWLLDGCRYRGLPKPEIREFWLDLLREGTPTYAPSPYQQLASSYRSAGHDRDAREVLMAQRRDQIARGGLGSRERTWARFTGIVLGFGWAPWRALYFLAGALLASAILAVFLGAHGALTHPPKPGAPTEQCTIVERVGVGLDLGTPLLGSTTRARDRCPINPAPNSATATALIICTWALQVVAWGLAALFIAGFTSAVRRT